MKKPKYLSEENWKIINAPEQIVQKMIFGFCEPETKTVVNGKKFVFKNTFKVKKQAESFKNELEKTLPKQTVAVLHGYLFGKYKRGWSVLTVS